MVRKTNPRRSATAGRMLALLGNTLTDVDKPVFTLEPGFDLIVVPAGVIASTRACSNSVQGDGGRPRAIPSSVEAISTHLPLAGDGTARLEEKALKSSRLRRRLRSIYDQAALDQAAQERAPERLR